MSDPAKKTTIYHFQKLQERFQDYTPTPESPLWNDYCTYLAMVQIQERKDQMLQHWPKKSED